MLYILSWLAICFVGCGLHFTFGLLHHNKFVAWGMAVNESTWEHLKIAGLPTLLWGIGLLIFTNLSNIPFAIFVMLVATMIVIVGLFYGYQIFTKKPILIVDIIIFFFALGVGMLCAFFILTAKPFGLAFDIVGYVGCAIIFALYVLFTYFPPKNFLFKDPETNKYGILGHNEAHCHHHHK